MYAGAQNFHDAVGGGMQKSFGLSLPVFQQNDPAGGDERRQKVFHVPVTQCWQRGQGGCLRPWIDADIEIRLLVIFVSGREAGAYAARRARAVIANGCQAIEIEMMRPAAYWRRRQPTYNQALHDRAERA